MSSQKILLYLDQLNLIDVSAIPSLDGDDLQVLEFTLIQPRFNTPSIQIAVTARYTDDLQNEINKILDGLIIKQNLEPPYCIKVVHRVVDHTSKIGSFVLGVLKAGAGALLGVATGGISNAALAAMTGTGGNNLLDLIFDDSEKIYEVGEGYFEIKQDLTAGQAIPINYVSKGITRRKARVRWRNRKWYTETVVPVNQQGRIRLRAELG